LTTPHCSLSNLPSKESNKRPKLNEPINSESEESEEEQEEQEEQEEAEEQESEEESIELEVVPVMKKLQVNAKSTKSPKPTVVENYYMLTKYTDSTGAEMLLIAMNAISGSKASSYDAVVSDDGLSLCISWKLPEIFLNANWLMSSNRVTEDSSMIVEWKRAVAHQFNEDFQKHTVPTLTQIISLPFQVQREAKLNLLCFPDGDETSVSQIFTVLLASTVKVHLARNPTVINIVRSPQPNSQGAGQQQRQSTGSHQSVYVDADM
jgi:hypothetical protein